MKPDIKALLPEELEAAILEIGEPKYRAKQIFIWLNSGVCSFDEMLNIPKLLRERLNEHFFITAPRPIKKQISPNGRNN